ncbi:serine/threonine-protein kinase [Amycolatopsis thailandensis]|uniref:serine/threonine-protein kinase n=1 Tax=Amycolatopsis thailandensis TaxID=589330 RepID=UPI0036376984
MTIVGWRPGGFSTTWALCKQVTTLLRVEQLEQGVAVTRREGEGRLVGGRYRLVGELGSGGFGRVWRAHDEVLDVDVAVKEVFLPPSASEAERAERSVRAVREARHSAKLREHPNVVGVLDVLTMNDTPWIVMQLVDGCSLQERLAANGALPVSEATRVAVAVLRALGAAERAGVTHRDVKPANIMLASDGQVLLADFGIAVHDADTALTATGMFIGSLEYTAPERAHGQAATAACDLFSLGATLYQAVEGVSPFHRDTPTATLKALLFDDPPVPQRAGQLGSLLMSMLHKNPEHRPTVAEARRAVEGLVTAAIDPEVEFVATSPQGLPPGPRGTKRTERPATEPYVTPRVRELAARFGIDLATVKGTGVGGRIRTGDVLAVVRTMRGPDGRLPRPRPVPPSEKGSDTSRKGGYAILVWIGLVGVYGAVFGDFWTFNALFDSDRMSSLFVIAGPISLIAVVVLGLTCGFELREAAIKARGGSGVASSVAAGCGFLAGFLAASFACAGFFHFFSQFGMLPEASAWATLGFIGVSVIVASVVLTRKQNTPIQEGK